jgi:hypothetical protein
MGGLKSPPRTRHEQRVKIPTRPVPTGEKWDACPAPSGWVPGGYRVPDPELPSLLSSLSSLHFFFGSCRCPEWCEWSWPFVFRRGRFACKFHGETIARTTVKFYLGAGSSAKMLNLNKARSATTVSPLQILQKHARLPWANKAVVIFKKTKLWHR